MVNNHWKSLVVGSGSSPKSKQFVLVTHRTCPQNFIGVRSQPFEISCTQTDKQTDIEGWKHNLLHLRWRRRIARQQNFPFPRQSVNLHSDINEYTSKVELYLTTEKVLPAVSKQAGCFENACSKWWSHVYLSNLFLPFLPILVIILSSRLTLQTFTLCLSALPIVELPNVSPSHVLAVNRVEEGLLWDPC